MKNIIVLGSNFGGMTSSLQIKRALKDEVNVTVISPSDKFWFIPSLIWTPFGRRKFNDITVSVKPIFEKNKINFIHDEATKVVPQENKVITAKNGELTYDYLVIATGIKMNFDIVENIHPEKGYINNIVIPKYNEKTYEKFKELVKNPGPIVVGATQGASCMGAAYEYLFNLEKELRKHNVRDKVELTWVTPEPYLGHFGIDGMPGGETMLKMFMKMFKINYHTDVAIKEIQADKIILNNGKELPYKMAMLMPPFVGVDAMQKSPELTDEKGFVPCNEGYQHVKYPNVYAVGLATQLIAPFKCNTPFGVPKTGYPTDVTAKIAAKNIVNDIKQTGKFVKKSWGRIPGVCIMDAGHKEVLILSDHLFKPRNFAIMLPNVLNDWTKVLLEKYFLWKIKNGYSFLP